MSNINGFLRPVIYLETGVPSRVIIFAVWFFSTAISLQGAVHQKRRKWLLTEVKKKNNNSKLVTSLRFCIQLEPRHV